MTTRQGSDMSWSRIASGIRPAIENQPSRERITERTARGPAHLREAE